MIPLIEKYRVENLNDIVGQAIAVSEVREFVKGFPRKKALILNGPVGVGKTSICLALAAENDMEMFELNASDLRNRLSLEEVLRPSLEQQSLFGKGKLILMDEADGITGSDRGGLPELIALIKETKYPIIITANDIWQKKFSGLRKVCKIVNMKSLSEDEVRGIIVGVLDAEGREIKLDTIDIIVKNARGDVRAALNDLESVILLGMEDVDDISTREKKQDIFENLKKLFQDEVGEKTLRIFDNSDLSIDEILLWIEENIPLEYQGKALIRAYESLSLADIFKGRIYRQQYWRFLVYQSFFLSGGVASATRLKNNKFISYKKPIRILRIWMANQKNAKMKSIVEKYSSLCHMSKKKAMKDKMLLPLIFEGLDDKTKEWMELDDRERDYLKEKRVDLVVSGGLNKFG
jgi:replication factor C large subunit